MRLFATAILLAAAPASAQAPAAMMACVAIVADADRLACFDRAMAGTSPEVRATVEKRAVEAAVIAKQKDEAAAVAKRDAFGAETLARRPEGLPSTTGEGIEAGIAEILTNAAGDGIFLLDNGQMWKQVDSARLGNLRVGDKATITRTGLGGYHLNLVRQKRWLLVKRLR